MTTYIVFVDHYFYTKRFRIKTVRKEVSALDICAASAMAIANGGIVSMIWPKVS